MRLLPLLVLPPPDPTAPQKIAAAVIKQAVTDETDHSLPYHRRENARLFLAGDSRDFQFWCSVAGLSPATIRAVRSRAPREGSGPSEEVGQLAGLPLPVRLRPTPVRAVPMPGSNGLEGDAAALAQTG
jgi:hypothetical protein